MIRKGKNVHVPRWISNDLPVVAPPVEGPLRPTPLHLHRVRRTIALRSLHGFVKTFWGVVEPGSEFQDNWHIRALCEHLEAVWPKQQIKKLLINMPPRHGKSIIVSVMWPMWLWVQDPSLKFLFASYAASLSFRDGGKCLNLLMSNKFQETFPDWVGLRSRTASKIITGQLGHRIATSVGGATTGEGGDILVMDDLLNALEAFSETERNKANTWMDQALSTRANDPRRSARVMVCQRLHEDDPAGHVLAEGGWDHLCLRARYEPYVPTTSLGFKDPRTEEGQLLWPERFSDAAMRDLEHMLGTYGTAGQLQQRPAPLDGGLLPRSWWNWYKQGTIDYVGARSILSVDAAFKDGPGNSYTVIQTWTSRGADKFLVDQIREHMDMPTLLATLRNLCSKLRPRAVLIEDKANGPAVISTLRREIPGILAVTPDGSKEARVAAISPQVEARNVYLPEGAPWVEDFVAECASFPNARHDDQVDAMTQAVRYLTWNTLAGGEIPVFGQANRWALSNAGLDDE